MSSFNKVERIAYKDETENPVVLSEYISYCSDELKEKYLVFKLHNNLNQHLYSFDATIIEYDQDGNMLEKVSISHAKFNANPNEDFVPTAKFKVNYDTVRIEFKVTNALFERSRFDDGKFTPVKYTEDEFRKDFEEKDEKIAKKQIKKNNVRLEKEVKSGKRRRTVIKNYKHYNVPKGPKVFRIIMSIILILVVAGTGLVMFLFQNTSNYLFANDDFSFVRLSNSTASIKSYTGFSSDVTIPKKANGYTIVAVESNAFAKKNINKVTIESELLEIKNNAFEASNVTEVTSADTRVEIDKDAFKNCTKLETVSLPNTSVVYETAFEGCKSLKKLDVTEATIYSGALKDCTALNNLSISTTKQNSFVSMFGEGEKPETINTVTLGKAYISVSYFNESPKIKKLNLTAEGVQVEYGALKDLDLDGYSSNGITESVNGTVISTNSNVTELTISNASDLSSASFKAAISNNAKTIRKLTITASSSLDLTFLNQFTNLTELTLGPNVSLNSGYVINASKLNLELGGGYYNFYSTFSGSCSFNEVNITGQGTISSFGEAFKGTNKLNVGSNVSLAYYSLSSLGSIKEVTIPLTSASLSNYGLSNTIEKLTFTNGSSTTLSTKLIDNYTNLKELTLPTNITYVNSNFISNCSKLESLVIPDSVINMSAGAIGSGNTSLKYVTVPFVGYYESSPMSFSKLNNSYNYCKYLKVTKMLKGVYSSDTYESFASVEALVLDGNIDATSDFLANLTLSYLELNSEAAMKYDYSGISGLNTVVYNNKDAVASISGFDKTDVKNIFVLKAQSVSMNTSSNTFNLYLGTINSAPSGDLFKMNYQNAKQLTATSLSTLSLYSPVFDTYYLSLNK